MHVLWNSQEERLRAGWRLTIYFVMWRASSLLLDHLLIPPLLGLWRDLSVTEGPWVGRGLHFAIYFAAVLLATWAAARWLDRREFRAYGLEIDRKWWEDFGAGLAVGTILMTLIFVVERTMGWLNINDTFRVVYSSVPFVLGLLGPLMVFIALGFCEELIFRGYVMRNVSEGSSGPPVNATAAILIAWVASSLLFGLFHIYNPNSSWTSTAFLTVIGFMLGLPVILTGRLGMAIGLHAAWNFVQGNVFGFPVSGNVFSGVSVLVTRVTGPAIWTGGDFGPEAGLLGILAVTLGCAMIVAWVRLHDGNVRIHQSLAEYVPRPLNRSSLRP